MTDAVTMENQIHNFMVRHDLTSIELSRLAQINKGSISGALNGNKKLSIKAIDSLTEVMGLPEGHFYATYIDECFNGKIHGRRAKAFILRCAEINRLDWLKIIIDRLAEDLGQIPLIFNTAEELLSKIDTDEEALGKNKKQACSIMYQCVLHSEKSNLSERLGISYYRLFEIHQADPTEIEQYAMQFIPFRNKIPEKFAMNGLIMLVLFFWLRKDWAKVNIYVDELYELAQMVYMHKLWKNKDFNYNRPLDHDRPFVYYYGQSYLLKAGYYEMQKNYTEAKKWTSGYMDLSTLKNLDLDEQNKKEIELFNLYAKANLIAIEVKMGNRIYIPEYVKLLKENKSEILNGITNMLESANRYHFFIDEVFQEFTEYLDDKVENIGILSHYKKEVHYLNYADLNDKYAVYCFRQNEFSKGLDKLLRSMDTAIMIGSFENMYKQMALFQVYRKYASKKQIDRFDQVCRKVSEDEEKNYGLDFTCRN